MFADGPFWTHLWDVARVDRAIWYSYAIVPLLVLLVLAFNRRLNWRTMLFGTAETTAYKFGVTFIVAHGAWAFAEPAPHPEHEPDRIETVRKAPLPPSRIDPRATGEIRGVAPANALVYIDSGLDHLVFAPKDQAAVLEHDGAGFTRLAVVQVGQHVDVISHDGRMHTLRATDSRQIIRRNHAVIPSVMTSLQPFEKAFGRLDLDCTVHRGAEHPAQLIVLGHPFFARADANGAFRFEGVPAGRLRITSIDPGRGASSRDIELRAGATAEVGL